MNSAIGFPHLVFAGAVAFGDCGEMQDAQAILDALDRKGVTREALAQAIGVSQPNATRLYKPDARTNKKRTLGYDEGRKLIEVFHLEDDAEPEADPHYLNEELLIPIVDEIAAVARQNQSESASRPLAEALARYLRQIVGRPAIHSSRDALEAVAQSVVPRPQ